MCVCVCVCICVNAHMYAVCGGTWWNKKCIHYLLRNIRCRDQFGEANIKVCIRETVCEYMDWIQMALDRAQEEVFSVTRDVS